MFGYLISWPQPPPPPGTWMGRRLSPRVPVRAGRRHGSEASAAALWWCEREGGSVGGGGGAGQRAIDNRGGGAHGTTAGRTPGQGGGKGRAATWLRGGGPHDPCRSFPRNLEMNMKTGPEMHWERDKQLKLRLQRLFEDPRVGNPSQSRAPTQRKHERSPFRQQPASVPSNVGNAQNPSVKG